MTCMLTVLTAIPAVAAVIALLAGNRAAVARGVALVAGVASLALAAWVCARSERGAGWARAESRLSFRVAIVVMDRFRPHSGFCAAAMLSMCPLARPIVPSEALMARATFSAALMRSSALDNR